MAFCSDAGVSWCCDNDAAPQGGIWRTAVGAGRGGWATDLHPPITLVWQSVQRRVPGRASGSRVVRARKRMAPARGENERVWVEQKESGAGRREGGGRAAGG